MPFDDTNRDGDGGGGVPWDCPACCDRGFIHVLRLVDGGRFVLAHPCPAACRMAGLWLAWVDEQEALARDLQERLSRGASDG